jgi:hypothetical protein
VKGCKEQVRQTPWNRHGFGTQQLMCQSIDGQSDGAVFRGKGARSIASID